MQGWVLAAVFFWKDELHCLELPLFLKDAWCCLQPCHRPKEQNREVRLLDNISNFDWTVALQGVEGMRMLEAYCLVEGNFRYLHHDPVYVSDSFSFSVFASHRIHLVV